MMPWTAVNSATWRNPKVFLTVEKLLDEQQDIQAASDDIVNYNYREKVLEAAANLVASRPKRRKTSKAANTRQYRVVKASSAVLVRHREKASHDQDNQGEDNAAVVPSRQSQRVTNNSETKRKPLLEITNACVSPQTQPDVQLKHNQPSGIAKERENVAEVDTTSDQTYASGPKHSSEGIHSQCEQAKINIVIEISSDDDTYSSHTVRADSDYDQFDDSVFDEVLEPQPISVVAQALDSATKCSAGSAHHPNGAPFQPFLHPCLLESLDSEALTFNQKGTTTPSLKHICFRIAEILHTARHLKDQLEAVESSVKIEIFATVHEVKYADRLGRGQGIVFGDIFFPDRPPYITAVSRTPYVAKDLVSTARNESKSRPVVKAALLLTLPGVTTATPCPKSKLAKPQPPQSISPQPEPFTLEVLHIGTSSWEEINEARTMIEKDFKAREGTLRSKITEYFSPATRPAIADSRKSLEQNHIEVKATTISDEEAMAQLAEESDDFDHDFSDSDIHLSLPEIEELLKGT